MKKKVIILTGIPSSGKTTATEFIKENFESIKVVRYGELLFKMKKREYPGLSYEQMRSLSSSIITKEDIERVDSLILEMVNKYRKEFSIVVESHGVTKENYGFRVTPYKTLKSLYDLGIGNVVYISSSAIAVLKRMQNSSKGRKTASPKQIEQNLRLQETHALLYATLTGSNFTIIENNDSILSFQKRIKFIFTQILQS